MTPPLRETIRDAAVRLERAGVPSPRHDAEALAAHLLGIDRGALLTRDDPGDGFAADYDTLVARREAREPLQHITGSAHFRRVDLAVGPGVFIPRPETEMTAQVAIDEAKAIVAAGRVPTVADLYAGSGPIAISIATEVSPVVVHAVELSDDAIGWLRRNAAGAGVIVHHDDVGRIADPGRSMAMFHGAVDIVTANPPYVPAGAEIRDREVVEHDPALALWGGGADGLDQMRVLERVAGLLLAPGGLVIAEHADLQGVAAPDVFRAPGRWDDVQDHRDLTGRPRYLTARRASA